MIRSLLCVAVMFFCITLQTLAETSKKIKDPVYKIHCSEDVMKVEIVKTEDVRDVYLENLKHYPEKACQANLDGSKATFSIDLHDIYKCMVTKILNRETGRRVYYHRVIMEYDSRPKTVFIVKCDRAANTTSYATEVVELKIAKRSPQFENFKEDEEVEITGEVTGRAPIPELTVGVRQNNLLISDELTVKPGTPLEMNIGLDRKSADIYGVMVSNMEVTDTREQEEILILNGCTVDPYLFQNFLTDDGGDNLRAEFKAFKFPESNFVLFKGTVNVCLDKCAGVECANGQLGFGRRRRDILDQGHQPDRNKIYEVSMATVVKVSNEPLDEKPRIWMENATLQEIHHPDEAAIATLSEEFGAYKYVDFQNAENGSKKINIEMSSLTVVFAIVLMSKIL